MRHEGEEDGEENLPCHRHGVLVVGVNCDRLHDGCECGKGGEGQVLHRGYSTVPLRHVAQVTDTKIRIGGAI